MISANKSVRAMRKIYPHWLIAHLFAGVGEASGTREGH